MIALYQRYKKLHPSVKASAWFAICSILQKGIQFITIPIFTRLLSTQEYGQYTLYQSWFTIFSIFATLNLSAGVFNNGMVKYEDCRDEYTSSMQGLSILSTFTVAMIYVLFHPWMSNIVGLPDTIMTIMFVQILFTPPLLFWSTRQRFEYKYRNLVAVTLSMSLISPAFGIWMVSSAQDKGLARIFSNAVVGIFIGVFFMVFNTIKGKIFFKKQYWNFALKFNLPLIPHYLSMIILGQCDRIMIGKYYGESQVAIYGLAYSLSLVMNIITTSVNSSFVPWTYQQCKKGNYKNITQVANILLVLIGAVSLIPALFAPELMAILGPAEYAQGAYLVAPISMSVFFTFLYGLFGNIEFYFEKSKFIMTASVLGTILNVILNAIFIPLLGYQAAAYTTLICYMAFSFAHYIFMKKTCKDQGITDEIYNIKKMFLIGSILVVISHSFIAIYQYLILRVFVVVIFAVIGYINRAKLIQQISCLKNKTN